MTTDEQPPAKKVKINVPAEEHPHHAGAAKALELAAGDHKKKHNGDIVRKRTDKSTDENVQDAVKGLTWTPPKTHPATALMVVLRCEELHEKYVRHTNIDFGDVYRVSPLFENGREVLFDLEFLGRENVTLVKRAFDEQLKCTMGASWYDFYSVTTKSETPDSTVLQIRVGSADSSSRKVLRRKLSEFILLTLRRVPDYREVVVRRVR